MAKVRIETPKSGVVIGAAATDVEAMLDRVELDPRAIVRRLVERIIAANYPSEAREREAAQLLRSYIPRFEGLLVSGDRAGVQRTVGEIEERMRWLTSPLPVRHFDDELRRVVSYGLSRSWTTEALEALRWFYSDGDEITDLCASSVKVGGRLVQRSQAREKIAGSLARTTDEQREKRGVERESVNAECVAHGAAPCYETL
jgi:hypothetical protein